MSEIDVESISEKLTIIVPTRNRCNFLLRLLQYFADQGVSNKILVADSSHDFEFSVNAKSVGSFNNTLKIVHSFDGSNFVTKCRNAVESIATQFTVFCADDDFLMVDSAHACVQFLMANPDYSMAMGINVSVRPEKVNHPHKAPCQSIEDECPIRRFTKAAGRWSDTFYGVHRTVMLSRACGIIDQATEYDRARVFPETLRSQLTVISGKVAILPNLHVLFELHSQNEHCNSPLISVPEDTVRLYDQFANALSAELAAAAGIPNESSRIIVDQYYGFLRNEKLSVKVQRSIFQRVSRSLHRQTLRFMDYVSSNPVPVRQYAPLNMNDRLCQKSSWKQACEAIRNFPYGRESVP